MSRGAARTPHGAGMRGRRRGVVGTMNPTRPSAHAQHASAHAHHTAHRRGLAALLPAAALLAVAGASCTETVAFLSIDLVLPAREPALLAKCTLDPRRAATVTLTADCGGEVVTGTYRVSQGTVSLSDVPLGRCTITVGAHNAAGRKVLAGQTTTELVPGENTPVTVTLLEEACSGQQATCDADGDGLLDADEGDLGTDPLSSDTDRDGLEDGFEVQQCCSNPLAPPAAGDPQCTLAIQKVDPPLGPAGESVMVKASTALKSPKVKVGGVALDDQLADLTVVFGKVGKGAVLGDVELHSDGQKSLPFPPLFPVLLEDPAMIYELDQKAGGKVGLMLQATDMVTTSQLQAILGTTGATGGSTARRATLLLRNRTLKIQVRLPVAQNGTPVALSTITGTVGVLLRTDNGTGQLQVLAVDSNGTTSLVRSVALPTPDPVDLVLEPGGKGALVLFRRDLQRVLLNSSAAGGAQVVSLSQVVSTLRGGSGPNPGYTCTGMAYGESSGSASGSGAVHVACNARPASCPAGVKCAEQAHLLQAGPLADCLAATRAAKPGTLPACWAEWTAPTKGALAMGAPVLDVKGSATYLLTTVGVTAAPWGPVKPSTQPRPLSTVAGFKHAGAVKGVVDLMAVDQGGDLFVVDGGRIRRMSPTAKTPAERLGRLFPVGRSQERAVMLNVTEDSSALDVVTMTGNAVHALMTVCLKRCATCLCR